MTDANQSPKMEVSEMDKANAAAPKLVYADLGYRFLAIVIDGILIGIVGAIIYGFLSPFVGRPMAQLIRLVIALSYAPLLISSERQATLGKMALHIKVTDEQGQRISIGKAYLRELSKILSGIIFMIGYLMAFWDDKKQSLHDKIAGTLVVKAE